MKSYIIFSLLMASTQAHAMSSFEFTRKAYKEIKIEATRTCYYNDTPFTEYLVDDAKYSTSWVYATDSIMRIDLGFFECGKTKQK